MVKLPLRRPSRRQLLRAGLAVLVTLGLLTWWLVPGGKQEPRGSVDLATGVSTGVYARYGNLLKEYLAEELPKVDVTVHSTEGSVQNIQKVVSGGADFTIAAADAVNAYQTSHPAEASRLRACARLYDDYMQLIVPQGSSIRSTRDLRGRRIGMGQPRSGVSLIAERLLKAAGLSVARDITPVRAGIDQMPDMLRRGQIDAFFWSGGMPTGAIEKLARRERISLVPLGNLLPALQRQGRSADQYRSAMIPNDAYPHIEQDKPVETVAVANLLITTDRADAALTEGLTRTVINNRDHIGRQVHAAQLVDLRTAIYTDPLRLHAGAARYYRSVKS
ncbi:TAXI family TRAP transporter solute-binding subunit [Streptomyces sp. NPDC005438]|uniref:TAXI family TRAP transporter solute-binding subunit n=1 Tax=Streptomyces sp. NPDC005438 TaxID=3156880 RepID=UPI0033A9E78E